MTTAEQQAAGFPDLTFKPGLCCTAEPAAPSVYTVPGLLSADEAESVIHWAEGLGLQQTGSRRVAAHAHARQEWARAACTAGPSAIGRARARRGPAFGEAYRDNARASVQDETLADALWRDTGLAALLKAHRVDGMRPVGLNPNIRVYR